MVVPEHMVETIKCLAMNFFISAPTLSQLSAAVAAFECEDELMKHVKMYKTNREILWRVRCRPQYNAVKYSER